MQQIIKLNPMYWYITGFRRTVMWGIPLDFNMFAVCGCCAVLSMLVGVWVFRKRRTALCCIFKEEEQWNRSSKWTMFPCASTSPRKA